MTTPLSRKALVVLVALLLATTAVSAEPRSGAGRHPVGTVASGPLESLSRLWSVLAGFWIKNGRSVDPNGGCVPGSGAPMPTKNGGQADPNGLCLSGQCAATTTLDNGCQMDPDGRCAK